MKYLCLAWEEERIFNDMSTADWQALRQETLDYVQTLSEEGILLDARPLKGAGTGAIVRVRRGERSVTDGPYTEAKEIIGGFFLIDVASLDEAVDVAAKWPSARLGAIEIRPIEEGLPADTRY